LGGVSINADNKLTSSEVNEKDNPSKTLDNTDKKIRDYKLDQNKKAIKNIQEYYELNKVLFDEIKKKVLNNYDVTVNLYKISFAFGLLLLGGTFLAAFIGVISFQETIIGGSAALLEMALVLVFKPIEKIHELISDYAQMNIITSSYQEQVGLRLVQLEVEQKETVGTAAFEINLAAANAIDLIQKYCEAKEPAKKQANQSEDMQEKLKEVMEKLKEFFKKKDKDAGEPKAGK
jgi:hypothetical protein